ncbi:MAG: biopolymer transporter ExbD [Pseudomonadota bacterium]|jgi:biopolymer transport protein ExbD|nr:biopolymer transporter ExbD [Pseudomonadota bacterium]
MSWRKHRREQISIDMAPLIDVVFLLLIFFMVTTTFREESQIEINLPQASSEPTELQGKPLEILIDKEGRYYVDSALVINTQIDTLKRALRKAMDGRDAPPVIVSADAMSPHQAVVTAMDAARQVGLIHLSIATRNAKE